MNKLIYKEVPEKVFEEVKREILALISEDFAGEEEYIAEWKRAIEPIENIRDNTFFMIAKLDERRQYSLLKRLSYDSVVELSARLGFDQNPLWIMFVVSHNLVDDIDKKIEELEE